MAYRLTGEQAIEVARKFFAAYVEPRQTSNAVNMRSAYRWSVADIQKFLPAGFRLENVEDSDFFPVTVESVAATIQRHARHD